jgi:hypothetical protein
MQDMQCQMVRDEESAQLMVTKGMACSFGMPLAPMALEIMREKRSIRSLLRKCWHYCNYTPIESSIQDVGEDLAGAPLL